jgi:hypothetical protein
MGSHLVHNDSEFRPLASRIGLVELPLKPKRSKRWSGPSFDWKLVAPLGPDLDLLAPDLNGHSSVPQLEDDHTSRFEGGGRTGPWLQWNRDAVVSPIALDSGASLLEFGGRTQEH